MAQATQADDPVAGCELPAGQLRQLAGAEFPIELEYFPLPQLEHDVEAEEDWY